MSRTIKLLFSGLILLLAFAGCDKEYSTEGDGLPGGGGSGGTSSGTAVYTWLGAPGSCATPIISGIYTAGTPMNAGNTIILAVDVTTVGTFNVTSGTNNGISFAGSGTFTITGPQIITLTATGTPTGAGTFNYIPGTTGCSFAITFTGGTSGAAAGTLDCATAVVSGTYTQGIILTGSNTISIPVNVTTAGTYSISTTSTNGVVFSGSGTLATGAQTIVLTGSGLPVNSGAVSIPVSLGASSCSVSITFIAGTPPAVGTLDCATATLAGTYTQGVALGASNTVSIPVNVTTGGPYSITTTLSNGVVFSGTGTLAAGAQTIVLTGSGTPVNSGAVTIPVTMGASSCNFSVTFAPGTSGTDYFRVKIDGVLTTFNVNLDGDITPLILPNTVAVSGENTTGTTQTLDLTVQSINPIVPGTYLQPLGLSFSTSRYFDPVSGQGWQPSTPSSPAFQVVVTAISATRITGTFSGQYFDLNGTGTNSKQFTQGEFSVPLP